MIELKSHHLVFSFPEVHREARVSVDFQRTLRIPDDDRDYPLPPGLGSFPLAHVDDFSARVPESWLQHGGVMLPMYQSEAMWLSFHRGYPFAIKIATGKINAVTGEPWENGLHRDPQDYLVVPEQPWLDGYCVEKGIIRQFVAMPLGAGYSAEEQLTGRAEHGGLQILVCPMKAAAYRKRFESAKGRRGRLEVDSAICCAYAEPDMGLAPGGRMRQEIFTDPFDFDEWDTRHVSRCFVHLCNARVWHCITGSPPPTHPPTAAEYTLAGMPWFEYYGADAGVVPGAKPLAGLDSVATLGEKKHQVPLPENESVDVSRVIELRRGLKPGQVRETAW